jgi:hypothetical protein
MLIAIGTHECQLVPVLIGNSKVLLVDTPGFDDTNRMCSAILTDIARVLSAQYELGVQLKGVVYIHPITSKGFRGSTVKNFEIFKNICGQEALGNVLLVTSRWDEVTPSCGAEREWQLKESFWAYMVGHGSNMSRFHGDRPSAITLASQLLYQDKVVLHIQKELVDEEKSLDDTVAGTYVSEDLDKLKKQYQEELASLERLKQDLLENDRTMRRVIGLDWEKVSAELNVLQNEQISLQRSVGTEVRQEIQKKRSGLSKMLPVVPLAINMLSIFVEIPPGVVD